MERLTSLYAQARCQQFPQFRELLLNTLHQLVPFAHASIATLYRRSQVSSFGSGCAEVVNGDHWRNLVTSAEGLLAYQALQWPGEPAVVNWEDLPLHSTKHRREQRLMTRLDIHHGMAIALQVHDAEGPTLIALCRGASQQAFREHDACTLARTAGHVLEALMVNRLRASLACNIHGNAAPAAVASADGWLIYPNAAFAAAWAAMATSDARLRVPRMPRAWIEDGAASDAVLLRHGWHLESVSIPDGLRVELSRSPRVASSRLTPREQEVACLYGSGYSHKDISRLLSMSPNTVRAHVGHIFGKLSINSRALLRTLLVRDGRLSTQ